MTEAITVMIAFVISITCGLKCLFISVSKSTSAQAKSCIRRPGFLQGIFSGAGGAKSIVMQISFANFSIVFGPNFRGAKGNQSLGNV